MHMHNANGRAGENIAIGVELGIRHFDSAIGGAGGCSFIPDAKGNISTEELLRVLKRCDVSHGMNSQNIALTNAFLAKELNRDLEE